MQLNLQNNFPEIKNKEYITEFFCNKQKYSQSVEFYKIGKIPELFWVFDKLQNILIGCKTALLRNIKVQLILMFTNVLNDKYSNKPSKLISEYIKLKKLILTMWISLFKQLGKELNKYSFFCTN